MITRSPKALILDRDGTLIAHVPYLADPRRVQLLPGVREGLSEALASGCRLFLHSNQSGVGRGLYGMAAVDACNRRLIELLELGTAPFSRICIAPEPPEETSRYRKPSPTFAFEVMAAHGLDAHEICYLGDRALDLQTARNAGTRAAGVSTGLEDLNAEIAAAGLAGSYPIFPRFDLAIRHVLTSPA